MLNRQEIARRALRQAERQWAVHANNPETTGLRLGLPALDRHLPQGLTCPALHEIQGRSGDGMATGFARHLAQLAGNRFRKPVFWIQQPGQLDSGSLYPPALAAGFDQGLYFIDSPHPRHSLWALEEILRSGQAAAVVAELPLSDLTASRRLQLAAEEGNGLAFLLSLMPFAGALPHSVARSRWQVTGGDIGWEVSLLRGHGTRPGHWSIERDDTEIPLYLAAPSGDGSLYPQAAAA